MSALRHGLTPKMKPLSQKRSVLVSALDIGSDKIVCLIARLTPKNDRPTLKTRSHTIELLGLGHTRSRGVKAGIVVDLAAAEAAVRQAIAAAEHMARGEVESVIVATGAGRMTSELFEASVNVRGGSVADDDVQRVLGAGSQHSVRDKRVVLHSLPIGYSLDGNHGVRDPRGMLARELGVDMHVVTNDAAVARNLMLAVERCHLSVEAMVAAPYVAGRAVLADDEADLGSAIVDFGAGTTTLAAFSGGHVTHCDGFAIGGHHVTMDLARGLTTTIAEAERIKTLYGSLVTGPSDERDMINVPSFEDEREPPTVIPRAQLTRIIKPRVEEILEMVRDRLAISGMDPRARIVLTGGASQLTGMVELATRVLGRQVRIGRPLGITNLPDSAKGPAFAVAAGLLVYPQAAHLELFEAPRSALAMTGTDSYFARVGRWLREGF